MPEVTKATATFMTDANEPSVRIAELRYAALGTAIFDSIERAMRVRTLFE